VNETNQGNVWIVGQPHNGFREVTVPPVTAFVK
jgi:hypothetical protein